MSANKIRVQAQQRLPYPLLKCLRRYISQSPFHLVSDPPFYGLPRQENDTVDRIRLFLQNAFIAIEDPTRADAVAAVGELTGSIALKQMHAAMEADPVGKVILAERPIVSKATIPYESLIEQGKSADFNDPTVTFGAAYGVFLLSNGFDPDERSAIRYISDENLAYVMLRYRQCHDYWHALTGLPPTVLGELGLKWLELFQTSLPLPAIASTVGSLRLARDEQNILWNRYLPWAVAQKLPFCALMNVYYEREFDTPLVELRRRLKLKPAPVV